ncbi:DNA/RNA non-specific endonuclease [Bacillus sp. TH44]|uniref:DNA/RNA non-specific endonuclease n=1 Tax=unclassified Bacillus (in: firmicutes) TaxID=185979 RepID=UPI0019114650|nr:MULTISPECIES: DNA/RNA non-specific endonuclease [unclassified Bacillus (in: firmicutes)]MBK5350201.1 DNA/RNA non-specific endonuclease [Bacillus sp. TH45]MBK5359100.1 DNA/RNA non-specific endonuclease [Bacillus sp. TH44]MBK5362716.1 DNA/RNA non-specific endonuclease [Bacillus sp. TH50]
MDVKYRPEPWQDMGDGMNRITKDALIKLRYANELLKRIDGRIRDLDSDGSIHFNPKDQSQKIGELLESYTTLQKYCGEVGRVVSEHIDKPFLVEMDKFAQKMRDTSILSFETNNRIGSTTTTVLPGAHAGYGSVPQTIQKRKDKITVEDIFRDSPAFDNVLRAEYKELKKQNPDAKLNYEEYKKVVPSTRGFEYKSIEDEQKKLEMIRDIGIGVGIIITTILCPPLGAAAAVVYGAVQIKSGIDGEDWGTHRKLSQEERVGNVIFGGLDAIPVVGAVGKGVKAFKGTSELADLAKLLKFKEGMPGFNPNLGKNVVQSLKENKTLKNALDAMKNTNIPVAVRTVDTGIGMKLPYIEYSTVGEVAGKFSKASTAAKDDAYQLTKGSGDSGVSKEGSLAKGTGNPPKITEIQEGDLGKHIIKGKNGRKELVPNVRYITEDGYKYTTDEFGRIVDVEAGELILQKGKRNKGMQVAAGREDRLPDDDGGHLIGTQFHGSGDIDNLIAQNRQINRSGGEWYNMEQEWANALGGKPPKKVSVKIEPVYSGSSLRPNLFKIKYQIEGQRKVIREILNKTGG